MLRSLISALTAIQLLCAGVTGPQLTLTTWFKTGQMLRLHVVAQDDTDEMQRVKLCVRDAVRACYAQHSNTSDPMIDQARTLLPLLTAAAIDRARAEGFSGPVTLSLETRWFDEHPLSTTSLPAGEYPALMVRLGDAQGHNWWGLLDPDLALWLAHIPGTEELDGPIHWDWSLHGLLCALFGLTPNEEAEPC